MKIYVSSITVQSLNCFLVGYLTTVLCDLWVGDVIACGAINHLATLLEGLAGKVMTKLARNLWSHNNSIVLLYNQIDCQSCQHNCKKVSHQTARQITLFTKNSMIVYCDTMLWKLSITKRWLCIIWKADGIWGKDGH